MSEMEDSYRLAFVRIQNLEAALEASEARALEAERRLKEMEANARRIYLDGGQYRDATPEEVIAYRTTAARALRAAYEVTQMWAGTGLAQNEWGVALVNALQALSSPAAGGEKP